MRIIIISVMVALFSGLFPVYAAEDVKWSYDGMEDNQDVWATLTTDFASCELGKEQSPIAIGRTVTEKLPALDIHYVSSKAQLRFIDRTIEVAPTADSFITLDNKKYQLKAIRFHSPGEHTIREKFYILEIHFLHEDTEGKKLILSVFAESGQENTELGKIIDKAPVNSGTSSEIMLNASLLIPASRGYYAYTGSLTVPPCTEGVEWRVLKNPIAISQAQLKAITGILGRNSRMEQPLYLRLVKETLD